MENTWEFFEELDEMVYVSDAETYELVYMNRHLREALGYTSHADYKGKMCYQVLQGAVLPCSFCTNKDLREGSFVSWIHSNPILNRRFLVKDSLLCTDGRKYRIEIAIDTAAEPACKTPYYYVRSETILNECMQQMFSSTDPDDSIRSMLSYLGETFLCERTYIFEIYSNKTASNTYEWCKAGTVSQKDTLQHVPLSAFDWWMDLFAENQVTVIPNLEDIRITYPESYAVLKPQNIRSLAAGPIKVDGKIVGFLGVNNPDSQMLPMVTPLLNIIGYFTSTLFKRRDLIAQLHDMSYHDQLTGAWNRHALSEQYGDLPMASVGILYCDITGLKQINDSQGHEMGDQMILHCYNLLRESSDGNAIYRVGGDEFIVLFPNIEKTTFFSGVYKLQGKIRGNNCHMALGYVWSDCQPLSLEKLITQADQVMYRNKRDYYRENSGRIGVDRRESISQPENHLQPAKSNTPFQMFLSQADCDMESLFQSVSLDNDSSYFYIGDMQRDLYYVSDNMRDDFGFQNNLVKGFLRQWSRRITTPEFQDAFWQDISAMLREKRTLHDLRYQVRDANGNNLWVRCYGLLKWDAEKKHPLFFSGRITHQDKNFVVDPLTNFPREHASFLHLNDLRKSGEKTIVIGFGLNGISEINNTKGRVYGDRLLKKIAESLIEHLLWKMTFYRLEGMRCMAVVNPACISEGHEALVAQIRDIVKKCYTSMDVSVRNVCAFGIMEYPNDDMEPDDLVENLISLIRVARQEPKLNYIDYSSQNIERMKQISNMALALSHNVTNNMEHFRIVVQPIVSAESGTAIGGEVLLRWNFEGRDISPGTFIPMLERENLIQHVGRWVFEQAVITCSRLHSLSPSFYLTFNISLHQLSDSLLLPLMQETLTKHRLDGASLVAELTESCLDEQPEALSHFVNACQKMGLRIALDDFGSGYSSLRMLLQYPSSIIKLDRSLVQEVTESEAKMHFIRSIVFACHQFGKTVCMEGVENAGQNEIIRNTGCDMIQGFYYHRPMELRQLYQLLSQVPCKNQEKA